MTDQNDQNEPQHDIVKPELPLHLAAPRLLNSINIRITLKPIDAPADGEEPKLLALANTFDGGDLMQIASKLQRGYIELDITDGFGKQRSMTVTPAELLFLMGMAEKFVQELPA